MYKKIKTTMNEDLINNILSCYSDSTCDSFNSTYVIRKTHMWVIRTEDLDEFMYIMFESERIGDPVTSGNYQYYLYDYHGTGDFTFVRINKDGSFTVMCVD